MTKKDTPKLMPAEYGNTMRFGVSTRHERLVGRAVITWGRIESLLDELLWIFLGVPFRDGRMITSRMEASRKIQLINIFADRNVSSEEEKADLKATLQLVSDRIDDRNFIVHALWATHVYLGDPLGVSIRRASPPNQILSENFPANRMYFIIDSMTLSATKLQEWRTKLVTLHKKPDPLRREDAQSLPSNPKQ